MEVEEEGVEAVQGDDEVKKRKKKKKKKKKHHDDVEHPADTGVQVQK